MYIALVWTGSGLRTTGPKPIKTDGASVSKLLHAITPDSNDADLRPGASDQPWVSVDSSTAHWLLNSSKNDGMTIPKSAKSLTVTLAHTDLAGNALHIQIILSVKRSNGATLSPLAATDPIGRSVNWQPPNVAKAVAANPLAGQAEIV